MAGLLSRGLGLTEIYWVTPGPLRVLQDEAPPSLPFPVRSTLSSCTGRMETSSSALMQKSILCSVFP